MPKQVTEELEARAKQSDTAKRATFDLLKNKPRAQREVVLIIPTDDGEEPQEISMLFKAIGTIDYDRLLSKHPPTTEQKADGASYNLHTFGPALLSKVCVDPEMSAKEWEQVWNSPDWNRGEIMGMFYTAVELCNKGLDIPFSAKD